MMMLQIAVCFLSSKDTLQELPFPKEEYRKLQMKTGHKIWCRKLINA
jgi:hypothetical protein